MISIGLVEEPPSAGPVPPGRDTGMDEAALGSDDDRRRTGLTRTLARLRAEIARLGVGDRITSSRALMHELGVSPLTVRRAVAQLVAEGVLTSRPGAGTYVARGRRSPVGSTEWQHAALGASPVQLAGLRELNSAPTAPGLSLAANAADRTLRADARVGAATARAARRPGAWSPPPRGGIPDLRSWFADELGLESEHVWIAGGCQGALSATFRAIVPSGSPILLEEPTYPGAVAIAKSAGMIPIAVPADEHGVIPSLLAEAFEKTRARLAYMQPTFANPDGRVLSEARRREVVELAAAAGAFIVEDDWARWLSYERPPPPPLIRDDADGHVISITSLTKAAAPSLRVGAIAARGMVLQRIARMRAVDDLFVPCVLQESALDFVTSPGWKSHLRSLSVHLAERMDRLQVSLATHLPPLHWSRPRGGLFTWLELPLGVDEDAIHRRARDAGVFTQVGRIFELSDPEVPHLRLSIGGLDAARMDEAVERLAGAIEPVI